MNIDKPVEFLGALVASVETGMGWDSEAGHCNIDLVEDPDNGKLFDPPALGTACIFKLGKLSFGGILKRYEYSEDVSSGRRYSVVLESPNALLTGVYLTLGGFQGTIYTDDSNLEQLWLKPIMTYGGEYPTNVINLFADKENYEKGGLFGRADVNSAGYPVKNLVGDLADAVQKGNFAGKVKIAETEYNLDFSELSVPLSLIGDYRYKASTTDLSTFISEICSVANFAYTSTITGDVDSRGVVIDNAAIKIKVISKREQPSNNVIEQIIEQRRGTDLISFSRGKEYADIVTQKVLLGPSATRYWLANRNYILPIWGRTGTGRNATYYYGNSVYDYNNPFTQIRLTLDAGYENAFNWVDTNLLEVRCALAGKECWQAYQILMALRNGTEAFTFGPISVNLQTFAELLNGNYGSQDLADTTTYNAEQFALWMYGPETAQIAYAQRMVNARFDVIQKAAQQHYGREFLVAIPGEIGGKENSFRWVDLDKKTESAWEPSQSAWAGDDAALDFPDSAFYDDEGRLTPLGIFGNFRNADYSSLDSEYGISRLGTNNGAVVKASIDYEWGTKWFDNMLTESINPDGTQKKDSRGNVITTRRTAGFVKVAIDKAIPIYDQYSTFYNGFGVLCDLILGQRIPPGNHNLCGFGNLDFPFPPAVLTPEYIGIPQKSTRYVWGPWFAFNEKTGQTGKIEIEEDQDMAPEVFGSIAKLNEVANEKVKTDLASLVESETGNMELAEIPQFDLAERFYGSGPYVTSMTINATPDGGYKTGYSFGTWTVTFGALSKYNLQMFKDARRNNYIYQKNIRDAFKRRPSIPIVRPDRTGFSGKQFRPQTSVGLLTGNMYNAMAYSLNLEGRNLGVGVGAVGVQEAMRMLGLNPLETFAAGYEQIYTPIFTYNQKDPVGMKQRFNNAFNQ